MAAAIQRSLQRFRFYGRLSQSGQVLHGTLPPQDLSRTPVEFSGKHRELFRAENAHFRSFRKVPGGTGQGCARLSRVARGWRGLRVVRQRFTPYWSSYHPGHVGHYRTKLRQSGDAFSLIRSGTLVKL